MSANTAGAGRKFLSLAVILFFAALTGFLVYEFTPMFKTPRPGDDTASGAYKIDKEALIADLEKKVRTIPAENVTENLNGYQRLLRLAPGNIRYKQKVDYYSARQVKTADGKAARPGLRQYIKIGFPAPRVLNWPETGQMLGRVDTGKVVEVLDYTVVSSGSLITTWYQIRFGNGSGWISKLGTTGGLIEKSGQAEVAPVADTRSPEKNAWKTLAAAIIEDYGGKITSVDRLDVTESHFSLYTDMRPEQIRQTCENIGYYIRNSTGESPVIITFINGIPVAKADPAGTKYQAKLILK